MRYCSVLKFILLLGLLSFLPMRGAGATTMTLQTANDLFADGNAFYRAQKYEGARKAYSQLLKAGYETAPVLYNMGTVEARLGSSTQALAYLTRAKKLQPRNENIRANLAFVKPKPVKAGDGTATAETLWSRVYGFFTVEEWLAIAWVALMSACCGGAMLFLVKSHRMRPVARMMIWAGCGLLAVVFIPAVTQYYNIQMLKKSIVVTTTELRSGPAERFTGVANLVEGQVVQRLDHAESDYKRIELKNGVQGYAKRDSLMKL